VNTTVKLRPGPRVTSASASIGAWLSRYGTLAALVAMIVGFGLAKPTAFLASTNLIAILNQSAVTAIVAGGLTFVLIAGQFDLSFGAVISLAGLLVTGFISNDGMTWWLAIILATLIGSVVGLFNGLIVTRLGVSAIITTLAMGTIVDGVAYSYSSGTPIGLTATTGPFANLGVGKVAGIPEAVIVTAVILLLLWVLLARTRFGHHAQAIGSNPTAAALSGVRVSRITIATFTIGAGCAAFGGVLLAARLGSGQVTAGDSFLLPAYAATFLGSAVLRDGEFHIFGTVIGVLIVNVGLNGLSILGASADKQDYFQGGILIIAMALSTTGRRLVGMRRAPVAAAPAGNGAGPKEGRAIPTEGAMPETKSPTGRGAAT